MYGYKWVTSLLFSITIAIFCSHLITIDTNLNLSYLLLKISNVSPLWKFIFDSIGDKSLCLTHNDACVWMPVFLQYFFWNFSIQYFLEKKKDLQVNSCKILKETYLVMNRRFLLICKRDSIYCFSFQYDRFIWNGTVQ